jgi:hypothetical protein
MKRFVLLGFLGLVMATTSLQAAEPKPGTVGLGWYSLSAPVGGRVWISPMVGMDLGLGFADKNLLGATNDRFHINVGIPVNVVMTEKVNFFIRPGVEFQTNARTVGTEVKSKMIVTADLGAEWFVTEELSLTVGHGLQLEQLSGPDDKIGFSALRALSFENVGFHFYFN